jgi:hypothetical protein
VTVLLHHTTHDLLCTAVACCVVATCRTHLADCGGMKGASHVPTVMLKVAPCGMMAMSRLVLSCSMFFSII